MKKVKKIMALALTLVMGMAVMAGCGESDKKKAGLTPEESIKVLMDANIFGKKDEIDKIGVSSTQFDTMEKAKSLAFKKSFLASSKMQEGTIAEAQLDSFTKTVFESLGKSDIKVGKATINGKTATLELTIKGIDMNKVVGDTVEDITTVIAANPSMKEADYMVKFMESYEKNIKLAPLMKDAKTVTITMTEKDGFWDVSAGTEIEKLTGALMSF